MRPFLRPTIKPKLIGWTQKVETVYKYPDDYQPIEAMINTFTMELPPPGESIVSTSPFFFFLYVLRPDRLRAFTISLTLSRPVWEENIWRGTIYVVLESYPSHWYEGGPFCQVRLDEETSPTFENRIIMRFLGDYDFAYRLVVWSSCHSRSGPGPFEITWRTLAETWQVVSHEE